MEPTIEQSADTIEVQLVEPKSFLRVTYINMGNELTYKMDGFILEKSVAQNVCFISCFYIGMQVWYVLVCICICMCLNAGFCGCARVLMCVCVCMHAYMVWYLKLK